MLNVVKSWYSTVKGFVTKRSLTWHVTKQSYVKMLIKETNHYIDVKYTVMNVLCGWIKQQQDYAGVEHNHRNGFLSFFKVCSSKLGLC